MNKARPKISIIIPYYNSEEYILDCIKSISKQSFKDFEIIIVNDGSTPQSTELLFNIAEKNKHIRVITQQNKGAHNARITGINNATGEWLCFIDADDTIPEHSLETLYRHTNKKTCSIVIGQFKNKRFDSYKLNAQDYRKLCIIGHDNISFSLSGKLYRKELFRFKALDLPSDIKMGEDALFNLQLSFINEEFVFIIPNKVYNYIRHYDSESHKFIKTPEYEYIYQKYRLLSIPTTELNNYYQYTIPIRLNACMGIAFGNPSDIEWTKSLFVKELFSDIHRFEYKIPLKYRLLFRIKHIPPRKLYIYMIKLKIWLSYRLSI